MSADDGTSLKNAEGAEELILFRALRVNSRLEAVAAARTASPS